MILSFLFFACWLLEPAAHSAPKDSLNYKETSLEVTLKKQGFRPILSKPVLSNQTFFVDQIYKKATETILVQYQLTPRNSIQLGKILELPPGRFYSSHTESGLPFSIFFYKMTFHQAKMFIDALQQDKSSTHWYQWLLPSAHSEDFSCHDKAHTSLSKLGHALDEEALQQLTWSCLSSVGSAATQKGQETLERLNPLALIDLDPMEFWKKAVSTYESLQKILPLLEPMMAQLKNVVEDLHPKLKLNFLCSAIGAQATEMLLPGGLIKKVAFLGDKLEHLQKLSELLKNLSNLYKKYSDSKTLDKAVQKLGSCVL